MTLPRDVGGGDSANLLAEFGYRITRQSGSHLRLTSHAKSRVHHLTLPEHGPPRVRTLNAVPSDAARYVELDKNELIRRLLGV